MLASVDEADAVLMDRWTILLDAHEAGGAENSLADVEPPRVPVCPGEGVAVAGPLQATLRVHPGAYPRPTTPGVGASTTPSMDREVEAQSSDCQVTGPGLLAPSLACATRHAAFSGGGSHSAGGAWAEAALTTAAELGWRQGSWTQRGQGGEHLVG